MLKTIEKQIKECQISEHEFLQDYMIWDHIVSGKANALRMANVTKNLIAWPIAKWPTWPGSQHKKKRLHMKLHATFYSMKNKNHKI
jgi:hypothetical protein